MENKTSNRTWAFAQNRHALRLFFSSTKDLFEEMNRPDIRCYKVELTDAQANQLRSVEKIGKARLLPFNFSPEQIISCFELAADKCEEFLNPFYSPEIEVPGAAPACNF